MVEISGLYTYPIKSCGGIQTAFVDLGKRGFVYDRDWMLVMAEGKHANEFISGRDVSELATIQPALESDHMRVIAPSMPELHISFTPKSTQTKQVTVWGDECMAIDEGDEAAKWFSEIVKLPVRLVRMANDFTRVIQDDYVPVASETGFSDGYPILILSEESLADLNDRLSERGKDRVKMNRFRPNMVVKNTTAYAEDTWKKIEVAGITCEVVKPCKRCAMITIDWDNGTIPDVKEPTATLATYRRWNNGVIMGQNVVHRGLGKFSVGQTITILES
jgi:uncharacterized protein